MSIRWMRSPQCVAPAMLSLVAKLASAQVAPVVGLKPPTITPGEFPRIVSPRELADGRLLISDKGENRIRLVSFDGKPAIQLGHVGAGPDEYRAAGALVPLPGDSTALIDPRNGRWLIFVGGQIAGAVTRDRKIESIPVGVSGPQEFTFT